MLLGISWACTALTTTLCFAYDDALLAVIAGCCAGYTLILERERTRVRL